MSTPSAELTQWLLATLEQTGKTGHSEPKLKPLQTEASFRQFYRVLGAAEPLVLMDSPPDKEANPQFVALAQAFADHGVIVPEIHAHNEPAGWLLLSDLGDTHFIDAYTMGDHERCLSAALEVLEQIATVAHPSIPPYTQERLADELDIFSDWLVTAACGLALPRALFDEAKSLLLANAAQQEPVCVHRDFHCKNLLISAAPASKVGVLDFQDALIGPRGYDLASLLHDCYWDFPESTIDAVIARVPNTDRKCIDLLAIQRQLKAIGIFARLAIRDSKTSHLPHIGNVLKSLCALCARYREFNALGDWLATTLQGAASAWVTQHSSQTNPGHSRHA